MKRSEWEAKNQKKKYNNEYRITRTPAPTDWYFCSTLHVTVIWSDLIQKMCVLTHSLLPFFLSFFFFFTSLCVGFFLLLPVLIWYSATYLLANNVELAASPNNCHTLKRGAHGKKAKMLYGKMASSKSQPKSLYSFIFRCFCVCDCSWMHAHIRLLFMFNT